MVTYYPNFPATYIKRAATPNISNVRNALIPKSFRTSLTLTVSQYVAPGDRQSRGGFALGQRAGAAETVAQADDFAFARIKRGRNRLP